MTRLRVTAPNLHPSKAGRLDEGIRWRVTFVDSVTAQRIEVEIDAPDITGARERGWAALRATRPAGLVVVELVDTRRADEPIECRIEDDERNQGVQPPERNQ